jgi:hypothetical protein
MTLSRRDLLVFGGLTLVGAAAAPCHVRAQASKRGGTLTIRGWDPPIFDPMLQTAYPSRRTPSAICCSSKAAYPGFTIDQFKAFAIKSRVHFRRRFDDSGFAKTILLVEPEQPFLGTERLEALPYRNVDISKFYPYGDPRAFPQRSRPC